MRSRFRSDLKDAAHAVCEELWHLSGSDLEKGENWNSDEPDPRIKRRVAELLKDDAFLRGPRDAEGCITIDPSATRWH